MRQAAKFGICEIWLEKVAALRLTLAGVLLRAGSGCRAAPWIRDGTEGEERSPANFCLKDDFSCPYRELEYLMF